jgi:hypothetical protein
VVESGIDVFHQRDTLLGEVCDEFLKRVIVEASPREGNDKNIKP